MLKFFKMHKHKDKKSQNIWDGKCFLQNTLLKAIRIHMPAMLWRFQTKLDTMLLTLQALLGLVYKCIIETLIHFHTCQLAQFFLASTETKDDIDMDLLTAQQQFNDC